MFIGSSPRAFTLIELMVAISIGGILMTLAYAPYSFYTDKSRVSLSVEKIEQALSKARLLSTTGYTFPGTSHNADLAVYIKKGAKAVEMRAIRAGTSDMSLGSNATLAEVVRLEDKVEISELYATPTTDDLLIVFRAPVGRKEIRNASGPVSATGWTVGIKGVTTGSLSKHFDIP